MLIINDYFELLLPPCAYIRDACREQLPRRNVGAGTFLPRVSVGLTALHRMAPANSHLQPSAAFLWRMLSQRNSPAMSMAGLLWATPTCDGAPQRKGVSLSSPFPGQYCFPQSVHSTL